MSKTSQGSRAERRARKEISVVVACRDKYEDKIAVLKAEADRIRKAIDVLKEKVLVAPDESVKLDLASEIKSLKRVLDNKEQLIQSFRSIKSMLDEMLNVIDAIYQQEQYSYIIKAIPERKLPRMIRNPNNIEQVFDLANKMLKDLKESLHKILIVDRNATQERKRIETKDQVIREQVGVYQDDLYDLIHSIEQEHAQTVDKSEDVSETSTRTNKA